MKLYSKYINFMKNRYGIDDLFKLLIVITFILILINNYINSNIIKVITLLLIIIMYYRCFSKNTYKRRKENTKYLETINKITKLFNYQKNKFKDRNTHIYRKCSKCKQKIRLPKKKGIHTVKCPNCGNKFKVKCKKDEKIKIEIVK